MTLQLLWEEYAGQHGAAAYCRSAFCQIYRSWEKRLKRSMRQRHFAGEKLFVDYDGRTVPIYGRSGEEACRAHLFVSAMGASGCAYMEATRSETLPDLRRSPKSVRARLVKRVQASCAIAREIAPIEKESSDQSWMTSGGAGRMGACRALLTVVRRVRGRVNRSECRISPVQTHPISSLEDHRIS